METTWSKLDVSRRSVSPWRQVAISGSRLALLDDSGQVFTGMWRSDRRVESLAPLPLEAPVGHATLSHSQQHLMVHLDRGRRLQVLELNGAHPAAAFEVEGKMESIVASWTSWKERDLLLISRREMVLEAYILDGPPGKVFEADFERPLALCIRHLVPIPGDNHTLFILGHLFSEMKDSLYAFSLSALVDGIPPTDRRRMPGQLETCDYAYRLAAGACRPDAAVLFRDPEEDEAPSGDGDSELGEIDDFRGLYVRRLNDGSLVERIRFDAPIQTGAPLLATERVIAVACPERLEIVSRGRHGGEGELVPGISFGLDPVHGRIARLSGEGELSLLDLNTGCRPED